MKKIMDKRLLFISINFNNVDLNPTIIYPYIQWVKESIKNRGIK